MLGRRSLVRSLFLRVSLVFIGVVLAGGALAFATASSRINRAYDAQLIVATEVLRTLLQTELREQTLAGNGPELSVDDTSLLSAADRKAFDASAGWRMFRVWRDGRLIMGSDTGPRLESASARLGFGNVVASDGKWRVFTLKVEDAPVLVQVGERQDLRAVLAQDISVELVAPWLLMVPVAGFFTWLALGGGLKALRSLVADIERRSGRDLTPLSDNSWPQDLAPLVRSVNQLLGRIDQSVQHERRFVDQAAHELRTPLAVVRLQAQMIAREADPARRRNLIGQLSESIERASRLIDRLLTLARLDGAAGTSGVADLSAEAVAALTDMAPLARQQSVELGYVAQASAFVVGDPELLRLVCKNLVENAVRHAPPHSEVDVSICSEQGDHVLHVVDHGPGIPLRERSRVLERFGRGSRPSGNGVGLGLSIVTEALRLLGGRLELRDRTDGLSGLDACVILPAMATAKI